MKHVFLIILSVLALAIQVRAQDNGASLDADAFQAAMMKQEAVVIDLRPWEIYADEHIEGAVDVDWEGGNLMKYLAGTDKDRTILLYCGSGYRSGQAKESLIKEGYTHVYDLKGGIETWEEAEKPVVKQ
ncbi:MAG: rhodanese-like domain-containing protein [Flavobacteriales bacterium]|nr:rhodanese-like domain-containing protein [Flavobacteriales bacterium]MEB2341305.1 rhodanese-like domain-containing protein [Flavobacteriia bacterium]